MKIGHIRKLAAAVVLGSAALLGGSDEAQATVTKRAACNDYQLAEIRQYIKNTCGGSGSMTVWCSDTMYWMWERRSDVTCYGSAYDEQYASGDDQIQ